MNNLATPYNKTNHPIDDLNTEKLKNCYITKSMFVGTLFGVHDSSLTTNLPSSWKRKFNFVFWGSLLKNKLYFLEDKNYYFVMHLWGNGYHHWLGEIAPKFFLFENEIKSGTLLFPKPLPRYIREFLEIFEFNDYKLFEGNCFVKNVNVISNPNSGHYNKEHLLLLKRRILQGIADNAPEKFEKIYVSRKKAAKRKVINEDEVIEYLKKQGFYCVELDNVPFAEQVNLFRHCKTFVSIHGAALTNSIFMPQGGRVVELFPEYTKETDLNACYYRLCPVLGLRHDFVWCRRENPSEKFYLDTDNIYVDLDKLREKINN